jgi:heme-degrading monooxygenase HmoA
MKHPVEPPYFAVLFTSRRSADSEGYAEADEAMMQAVTAQPGYLGYRHFFNDAGQRITISYWRSEQDLLAWRRHEGHRHAQQLGRERWYDWYEIEVCHVTRAYRFGEE